MAATAKRPKALSIRLSKSEEACLEAIKAQLYGCTDAHAVRYALQRIAEEMAQSNEAEQPKIRRQKIAAKA